MDPYLEGRAHGQGWPPGYGQIRPRRHPDPLATGDSPGQKNHQADRQNPARFPMGWVS